MNAGANTASCQASSGYKRGIQSDDGHFGLGTTQKGRLQIAAEDMINEVDTLCDDLYQGDQDKIQELMKALRVPQPPLEILLDLYSVLLRCTGPCPGGCNKHWRCEWCVQLLKTVRAVNDTAALTVSLTTDPLQVTQFKGALAMVLMRKEKCQLEELSSASMDLIARILNARWQIFERSERLDGEKGMNTGDTGGNADVDVATLTCGAWKSMDAMSRGV